MTPELRMKVEDLFAINDKTIFAGVLQTPSKAISRVICAVQVDGKEIGQVEIEGEVLSGSGSRDLWTRSKLPIDRSTLERHEVWLVAKRLS
jgi:hypothetical protein